MIFIWKFGFHVIFFFLNFCTLLIAETVNKVVAETSEHIYRGVFCIKIRMLVFLKIIWSWDMQMLFHLNLDLFWWHVPKIISHAQYAVSLALSNVFHL